MRMQLILAGTVLAAAAIPASAASLDKQVDVKAPASKVWSMIGPFCSIEKWHPAIAKCTEEHGVRTLSVKGGGTFVEKRTKDEPSKMEYSYVIEKSPLPITNYKSTLKVTKVSADESKVEWSSTYTPDKGKEEAADKALTGVYQSGLDNIQKMAAQ